ncbi:uncharacterized protein LOC126240001 [Schistocerca nitens]|uniref:uncharacterized protein LOC126240001 n=1 Tax=Schistocerca nitens TaxID=7011 RepID=UPI002118DE5D|nr:uncharacterized protein LOC126240001 [Schistocerca nitens]
MALDVMGPSLRDSKKVLSVCTNLSIFDPDSIHATKFYCHLHQLLQIFVAAPRSKIVWNSVSVLQQATQNPAAKTALLHVHRFASVLGRLLVAGAATLLIQQKIQLLKLLQELTYDIEVTWQEALIPGLIHTLVLWVCGTTYADDGSQELVGPSLGVLVNLCHKNLVGFCILAHCIDTRDFLKIVTRMSMSNCDTHLSIQAFKMMRILRANDIPEAEILSFCKSSFKTALDALQNGEIFVLRQTVDFCVELFTETDSKDVIIHKYKSLQLDIQDLLNQMSDGKQPSSIALCLELLAAVAAMGAKAVRAQFAAMVALALRWIHIQTVSTSALCVLHAVIMEIWPDQDITYSITDEKIDTNDSAGKDETDSEQLTSSTVLEETVLEQLETGLLEARREVHHMCIHIADKSELDTDSPVSDETKEYTKDLVIPQQEQKFTDVRRKIIVKEEQPKCSRPRSLSSEEKEIV